MRIILVAFYKVFPPIFGGASVTYNFTKYLCGEKYLIHLGNVKETNLGREIKLITIKHNSDNNLIKLINIIRQFHIIMARIVESKPDIIIMEGASWSLYYLILFLILKYNKIKAKLIYHVHNVEYLLRKEKNNKFIATITRWAEGILLRNVDAVFAVSKIDAQNFEYIYGIKPKILPNGVDMQVFNNINDEQIYALRKKYNLNGRIIFFMGIPNFRPNKEAITFLVEHTLPILVKDFPDIKLAIIGGKISYQRPWLLNPGNIPFEEVPVFTKACDICVAPIFAGSGTRLKVLEYLAATKPVVSTSKAVEGISVKDKENVIIAEEASEFIEAISYLLKNPEVARKIGEDGKRIVEESYSWQKIMQDFNKTLYNFYYGTA